MLPEPVFVNLSRCPRIYSQPDGPVRQPYLSYRPARLHRLAESIHLNQFLGPLNDYKYGLCCAGHSSKTIFPADGDRIWVDGGGGGVGKSFNKAEGPVALDDRSLGKGNYIFLVRKDDL